MVWVGVGGSQRYLDEAEREKMQYAQELKEYQQTEAYQITSAKIHDKRIKKGEGDFISTYFCVMWAVMHIYFSSLEDANNSTGPPESSFSKVFFTFCLVAVLFTFSFPCSPEMSGVF